MLIEPAAADLELNRAQYDELRRDLETSGFNVTVDTRDRRGRRRYHAVTVRLSAGSYATAAEVGKHLTHRLRGKRTGALEQEQIPIYDLSGELLEMVRVYSA